jgi:isocitrate dehydrogenase
MPALVQPAFVYHQTKEILMSSEQHDHKAADAGANANSGGASDHEDLYDRYTQRASELFQAGQDKSREAMEKAMDAARQQLSAASEFSAEQGENFKEYMRRDLAQTERDMRAVSQGTTEHLHPARLGAGAVSSLARMLETAGSAMQSWSRQAEDALHFGTGDITTAGTLTCVACGQTLQLKRTSRVPPCPSCSGTQFRKGY